MVYVNSSNLNCLYLEEWEGNADTVYINQV